MSRKFVNRGRVGVSSLTIAALCFSAALTAHAGLIAPQQSFAITFTGGEVFPDSLFGVSQIGPVYTAAACVVGADLNGDGLITGDAGFYDFFPVGDANNEWTTVTLQVYRDNVLIGDYTDVSGGSIAYPFFLLGLDPNTLALYGYDLGADPGVFVSNPFGFSDNLENTENFEFGTFSGVTVTRKTADVPEPGSVAFGLVSGVALLGLIARKRK